MHLCPTLPAALALLYATLTTAIPLVPTSAFSASMIAQIDPRTTTCVSSPAPNECRTASQAAPFIGSSFASFNVTDSRSQAALLAVMLYETGGLKYSVNHYPGVPGQGTRNMQSPAFNVRYAQWLAVHAPWSGITSVGVQTAQTQGPAAVLALVNDDRWGFASAAWFLQTQCSLAVRTGLAAGTLQGWSAYLTQCIGTEVNNERTQLYNKALASRGN